MCRSLRRNTKLYILKKIVLIHSYLLHFADSFFFGHATENKTLSVKKMFIKIKKKELTQAVN